MKIASPSVLNPQEQQRLRTQLLASLAESGVLPRGEIAMLSWMPLDSILDATFRFTDCVRVRVSNDRTVAIMPESVVQ